PMLHINIPLCEGLGKSPWRICFASVLAWTAAALMPRPYILLACSPRDSHQAAANLLKVYRFDEPKHYLSCIFNGLRLSRKDHGIYPEYLHLSRNPLNLQYRE